MFLLMQNVFISFMRLSVDLYLTNERIFGLDAADKRN